MKSFDLEKALAGEPVELRNGGKDDLLNISLIKTTDGLVLQTNCLTPTKMF